MQVLYQLDLRPDLGDDSVAELRRETSGSTPASTPTSTGNTSGGRTYAIDDLAVRVVDSGGPLASVTDASLHKEGDDLRAGFVALALERVLERIEGPLVGLQCDWLG